MGDGTFVKAPRGNEEGLMLVKRNSNAFILLYFISQRARRTKDEINNLDIGEAMIGDFETYGMSRQNYRTAKEILKECNFITTKVTNKGTIAKIINTSIFDINIDGSNHQANTQVTINQPSGNHQLTTNKNDKNDKNVNNDKNNKKELSKDNSKERFEIFWKAYPKKIDRIACLKKWQQIKPDAELLQKMLTAIEKQKEWRAKARPDEFRPEWKHPTTWLNKGSWEWEEENQSPKSGNAPVKRIDADAFLRKEKK